MSTSINCQEACINGCVLGDKCPNLEYVAAAQKLLKEKSMDEILRISANRWNKPSANPEQDHQ